MKLLLKEFQTEAVGRLVKQLRRAAREAKTGDLQSVGLASPTGSGKTVMVTAAIEAIIQGDDEVGPDADATFLWITDQPELNEQTRRKMLAASSVLSSDRLVVIDASFDHETFRPGVVHFLNIQKLGKEKGLVTSGDERTYTIWDTVTNTVASRPNKFFVIIDEAHRGMTESARSRNEASTIIQKFIKGSPGEIPPVPLILGISATPERFTALVQGAGRTNRPVDIKPQDVRTSGLIKEVISLYHPPKAAQHADMTMLRAAVRSWQSFTKDWDKYCAANKELPVRPILVVQVQDGSGKVISKTDLAEAIQVIRSEAGHIDNNAFAHSFQEGTRIQIAGQDVRYIAPPDVQTDADVRVVFFKSSLNTGWDCPRAEVMMSFRVASDATLIAQLVGRMVRTPLARRIDEDEGLNSVYLYLPHYDEEGLRNVVDKLTKADADNMPPVEVRIGVETATLSRAQGSDKIFAALENLPSYEVPRVSKANQVRRLMKLARLLAHHNIDAKAPDKATKEMLGVLRAEYGRRKRTKDFKALVEDKSKVQVRAVNFSFGTDEISESETVELDVSPENLEDLFEAAGRKIGEGLHKIWWRSRVEEDRGAKEKAKLELIALSFLDGEVVTRLEEAARTRVQDWLKKHRAEIAALSEGQRQEYDEVRRLASEPEERSPSYPLTIDAKKEKQRWAKHIYVDDGGNFPSKLNTWETKVAEEELKDKSVVGWLRNPDRKPWSLCVPYRVGAEWRSMYPDFLFVRQKSKNLVVDLLDPHSLALEDAPAKAAGLAAYARKHSDKFGRIELIVVDGEKTKRLNLSDERICTKVMGVSTTAHLRQLFDDT